MDISFIPHPIIYDWPLDFRTPSNNQQTCRFQAFHTQGHPTLVVFSGWPNCPEPAFGECIVTLANDAWQYLERPAEGIVFYTYTEQTDWTLYRLEWDPSRLRLINPHPHSIGATMVHRHLGDLAASPVKETAHE